MLRAHVRTFVATVALSVAGTPFAAAQGGGGGLPDSVKAHRWDVENELQSIAVVDRKVMIADARRRSRRRRHLSPEGRVEEVSGDLGADAVQLQLLGHPQRRAARHDDAPLTAIKRGYAYIDMQERGHFFSEGNYDILGPPLTDGVRRSRLDDRRSRGRTARSARPVVRRPPSGRWAVAAPATPGFAAMNVQGFGAGVGRVGPYYEQGNWYRGGAVQMLFIAWLYGEQNQVRPMLPTNTSQADLIRASKSFDLAQHLPPVDWSKAFWHLPEQDIMKEVDGPHGIFADSMPVATGGAMIKRAPNDPAWYRGGLFHDNMQHQHPGPLVHVVVRRVGRAEPRAVQPRPEDRQGRRGNQQWAIIAPVGALRVHARHRAHHRRRARAWATRASTTTTSCTASSIAFLKGENEQHARHAAEGQLLHDGDEQVADAPTPGRPRRASR